MAFTIRESALVLVPLALAGCASYSPQQMSSMSSYKLCELQIMQGPNLTAESKRALQSELDRRKDNCSNHLAAIRAEAAEDLHKRTYGNQAP